MVPFAPKAATVRHRFFSPARVWALAINTLTELIRQKVFYFLLFFALLLIGSSSFLLQFSFQDQFQMLKAFSLGAMSIFTSLLAILPTAGMLPKDIEDRTLYTILAKPVSRAEYLLGKLLGVVLLLLVAMLLMGAMFAVVLLWRAHVVRGELLAAALSKDDLAQQLADLNATAFNPNLWAGGLVIYVKACLLASMTLFVFDVRVVVAVYDHRFGGRLFYRPPAGDGARLLAGRPDGRRGGGVHEGIPGGRFGGVSRPAAVQPGG